MTQAPLSISALDVDLGARAVLRGLDLEVAPGAFVAVLGASGCGKTTLLRTVAGFVTPPRGRISLAERPVADAGRNLVAPEARGLGVVFQDYALFPHLDVAANVGFGLEGRAGAAERVREMLDLVRLEDYADSLPQNLSGGQQQRVALARALAPAPDLLLLDEPFANLDATLRGAVADELRRILRDRGTAALMVTHDRDEALGLADHLVILQPVADGGRSVVQAGSPSELYRRPVNALVARTTGPMSALPARSDTEGRLAHCAFGSLSLDEARPGGLDLSLLVRPEDLRAIPDERGPAHLVDLRYEGRSWRYELAGGEADDAPRVRVEATEAAPRGNRFRLEAQRPLHAVLAE